MSNIFDGLNDEQKRAVEHIDGALLILAGAGSGKTKTLTTRLAYLIDEVGISPTSTLTLTFTNKAASEMKQRALNLIRNKDSAPPLLCTFHRFGLLFLKFHINRINREPNFILIDTDDKKKIIKNLHSNLPTSFLAAEISRFKNDIVLPNDIKEISKNPMHKEIAKIYEQYNAYLLANNMLDFDDLLLVTYEILDSNPSLASEISDRYKYIMVDEYQDTNDLQYKLLQKLCKEHSNICVVGDDDQSIYSWRGANINNILDFTKQFSDAKVIKLEQNYRSTTQILEVANNLIKNNEKRLGKKLISVTGNGKDVEILESIDERIEALNIARKIKNLLRNGAKLEDIAILFRLNALSRALEDGLRKENIPYKLIGAVRFYERAEIKDILSYFRLIINIEDNFSFMRIINRPKRGIGKVTQDRLESFVKAKQISILKAISKYKDEIGINKKHLDTIEGIFDTINELKEILEHSTMGFLEAFKEKINILDTFNSTEDEVDRKANIDEFYGFFRDYILQNPTASLEDFLNDIALSSDDDKNIENAISCMSVHSSKGLEFKYLFIIGLEEGFFPLIGDTTDIQEERRLGYVAFTRAKSELYVSFAKSRFYKGKRTELQKSRFLAEAGLIDDIAKVDNYSFNRNDLVNHKIFGIGRILDINKSGSDMKLKINFGGITREILSSFVSKV
ncbi:ATP-dependent helicase [Helicobacter sp. MIT 99-5507]|uniref:ATP-dependent helicase n=1 Tax=Helicobacter sp. MIT 99-5507 TaxID=152489 RepID=UPI000E1ECC55|nr:UvrD-helicase domain-containing protein [Helicobacter sp. MIT 99-5507]RDU57492.1 ATP-dependent DNA helicase [Helicobacter sp. MIT 99-5507]